MTQVLDVPELQQMQATIKEVYVDQAVAEYIVRLVHATREHPGDLPRRVAGENSLNLYRSSQAFRGLAGRDCVIPDDVKQLAVAVLAHRLIVKSQASSARSTGADREGDPRLRASAEAAAAAETGRAQIS